MICFFLLQKDIVIQHTDCDLRYEFHFKKAPSFGTDKRQTKAGNIYFSTTSNYKAIVNKLPQNERGCVQLLKPETITKLPNFPKQLESGQTLDAAIAPFQGGKIRIGIINALSNAIGDFLVATRAFEVFYKQLLEHFAEDQIEITFFQLNPARFWSLTQQLNAKVRNVLILPSTLDNLLFQDLMIDLSGIIAQEKFNSVPMVDFFLEKFCINCNSVCPEEKRIRLSLPSESVKCKQEAIKQIQKGRPILLFHSAASSAMRSMDSRTINRLISNIIKSTDYLVVSCTEINFTHPRFVSLHNLSETFDDFAAIISQVDAVITVDTCTYHIADAFNIPTVALFTTIDPKLRTGYYPYVDSIFLEKEDGQIYGKHKEMNRQDCNKSMERYRNKLWDQIDISEIISKLDAIKELPNSLLIL